MTAAAGVPGAGATERPAVRASDAERHRTVEALQDAAARGVLGFEEAGQRMSAAYASRYRHELSALTRDLPPAPPSVPVPPGWRALGRMAVTRLRADLGALPGQRLDVRRVVALVAVVLLVTVTLLVLGGAAVHALVGGGYGWHDAPGDWRDFRGH